MNRLFAAIAVLFLSLGVFAQTPPLAPPTYTVAAGASHLPSPSGAWKNKVVNVSDSLDCVNVVSGSFQTQCFSTGAVWTPWGLWKANNANAYYNTGNVGIGTASPDNKLTVNGTADKPGGGSWATFSDERLKNIKGRFTPGLKAVLQLHPIRYEYKRDNALNLRSEGEHVGFSAQAVQKIIPEAVTKTDKGYLLVNNDPILWTMLNAIKEQQAQIEQQHQQIVALKRLVCRSHRRALVCR